MGERHTAAQAEKFNRMKQDVRAEENASTSRRPGFHLLNAIRHSLAYTAMTVQELRRSLQKNDPTNPIKEEEVLRTLEAKEDEFLNVRGVWMQAHSQKEEQDRFRMCAINLFRTVDAVTKEEILEEYKSRYGSACDLTDAVMRSLLKEFSERQNPEDGSQAFVFKGARTNLLR